jgi:outer membrane protein assembly factor BamB
LYFFGRIGDDTLVVDALDADGTPLWRTDATGVFHHLLALGPDDQVVYGERLGTFDAPQARLSAIDRTGALAWQTMLSEDGQVVGGPAIANDGAIYVELWTERTTQAVLVVLEPTGAERLRVDLPPAPWGGGTRSLSVGVDGTAYVKEGEAMVAVDARGAILWERPTHPNIDASGTLDAAGRMHFGSGGGSAIDVADGTDVWVSEIPAHRTDLPGGGASFAFPGPATIGEGVLYFMANDAILYAASTPDDS